MYLSHVFNFGGAGVVTNPEDAACFSFMVSYKNVTVAPLGT
jgi:hypothetical protein